MEKNEHMVSFRIEKWQSDFLRDVARLEVRSIPDVMREILDEYIDERVENTNIYKKELWHDDDI